jgi:hypothetical protein
VTASTNARRRLYAVAKVLRQFGLVDEFGLSDAISNAKLPSKNKLEDLLKTGRALLPQGASAKFLAACLHTALVDIEGRDSSSPNPTLCTIRQNLISIKVGPQHATRFHNLAMKLLRSVFDSRLGDLQKEKKLLQGLKRLDIKANNDKQLGFFANLRNHHSLHCPYIFCECKNYAEDPANPEFDQLLGRLNKTTTMVGLLLCRKVKDNTKVLKRCREPYSREGKLIIVLEDRDSVHLADQEAGCDE